MWAPQLALTEALQTEARHFIDCVEHGKPPTTDGHADLRVVEAATRHCPKRVRWFRCAPR
jgi:predicted dehydrogenase